MKTLSKLLALCAIVLVALVLVASVSTPNLYATKEIYKAAKDKFGKDIKGCKHCHVKALPKEDDHEMNDLGKWLIKQKEERGAEEVDVAWLAEYPGSH